MVTGYSGSTSRSGFPLDRHELLTWMLLTWTQSRPVVHAAKEQAFKRGNLDQRIPIETGRSDRSLILLCNAASSNDVSWPARCPFGPAER
jgi:hypothetical protein